jgi:hypothetical protein
MDPSLLKLKTPEECEQYILNVRERWPQLVADARRKLVELRAAACNANTDAEREAIRAVFAYEEALSSKKGHRVRASRTWPMIDKHGAIGAVERLVSKRKESSGYTTLAEMGMKDFAFESVVLRHPEVFSEKALTRAKERIASEQPD